MWAVLKGNPVCGMGAVHMAPQTWQEMENSAVQLPLATETICKTEYLLA